ncbi:MAG: sigma-70 family RNA polymerase sigma factor [Planctomycetes bacterium]|nr:sigma-70 family RNA polymerase sigma factor [Planctomycetota bacterium]
MNPSLTAPSDETLMALCGAGSESAFTALVERHSPAVYRYFRAACRDPELAWDLVQETFLRVHQHRDRYRAGGTFKHWLFVIAANLARSDRRARIRRPARPSLGEMDFPSTAVGPEQAAVDAERLRGIRAALEDLPAPQRDALRLRLLEGLDFEAIGQALDCPTTTARTRVHYGLKTLRTKLAEPGADT